MRAFRDLPIQRKLTLIILLTSAVAVLLASAGFVINEQFAFKRDIVADLATKAEILGFNSASALSFDDARSAERTLESLGGQPNIVAAAVYRREGELFAKFEAPGNPAVFPAPPPGAAEHFAGAQCELFRPIVVSGDLVGTIFLRADFSHAMKIRLWRYSVVVAIIMAAAMAAAYVIGSRLQRVISAPVTELAAIASRVAAEKNYSVRAVRRGEDELGRLIDGFNAMLSQIQARDADLQTARDELESRVTERTRELAQERARLQFIFEAVPVGISLLHVQPGGARTRLINDAHLQICGLTRERAMEPGIFARITHPEDAARQQPLIRELEDGRSDRFSIEKRYLVPGGRPNWVVYSIHRWKQPNGSYEDLSTVVDISALKHAQEETVRQQARFKLIFDSVPVGFTWMVQSDPASRIVNPAHARITGVPGERCRELHLYRQATPPEDQTRQDALHARLIAGEIDHYELEKRYVHASGTTRWAALTVHLHRHESGGETQEISTLVDITERKEAEARLAETHRELLNTSRQAGMAEVATGVLHNVGNVLNSVNVSATLVSDRVRHSKATNVAKLAALFGEHRADLAEFVTRDPRGRMVADYLGMLAEALATEQKTIVAELDDLRKNIEHIKDIVAMQQSHAKTSGVIETVSLPELVEDALRMNISSLARHDVTLVREFRARGMITTDKHKIIQILINLVRNAKFACDESGRSDKRIVVRTEAAEHAVKISVADNGVGIPPENLTRIFGHGFTTRPHGHGFGLHSGALAARELGGTLSVHSAGAGRGATFVLELPHKLQTHRP